MTTKIINLKKAIYDLHIKMGCSTDQANFFMLREAHEWEEMGDTVSNLLRGSQLESEMAMSDKRDDPDYKAVQKGKSSPSGGGKRKTRKRNNRA